MLKRWFVVVAVCVAAFIGFAYWRVYQAGYFEVTDIPDGAYIFSMKNGFKGVVLDAEVQNPLEYNSPSMRWITRANPDRRYMGIAAEVPSWLEDAWSTCAAPSDQEREEVWSALRDQRPDLALATLDAICFVDVDGQQVFRGALYSVPRL